MSFQPAVGESATSALLPFRLELPCVHFSDLTDLLCVSEAQFPSVKFWNVIHPWHKQRSKGYGAEGSSARLHLLLPTAPAFCNRAFRKSCCFHSRNYCKTGTARPRKRLHFNVIFVSFSCSYISYLISGIKLQAWWKSHSLSHSRLEAVHSKALSVTLGCLIKVVEKKKAESADIQLHFQSWEIIRCYQDGTVLKAKPVELGVKVQMFWYTGILEVIGSVGPYHHTEVGTGDG